MFDLRKLPMISAEGSTPCFLPPEMADDMGLVAVGGELSPTWLLEAYRRGIFPMYAEDEPLLWWSPNPRAVLPLDGMHVSRRLRRTIRAGKFRVTRDRAFGAVIRGCADRPPGEGNWLTADMIRAYETLHRLGYAHSFEAWHGDELGGGVYGVALGGLFAAESMFTRVRDGSKVALAHLVEHARRSGFTLLDVQFVNDHTQRLGAVEIPRREYLKRLREALRRDVAFV
jgi:leucyl/phenylalanyl-tRNA--protein transferase